MKRITDRSFRYHDSATHGDVTHFSRRLKKYAEQMKPAKPASVTALKLKRVGHE
jgi:hypothetical protein